jgi:hypothetical protein
MTYNESRINTGGLFRCCLNTIMEYIKAHSGEECEDMILDCIHEAKGNRQIKLEDGVWKWNDKG